jgi:hypothetical protein
MGYPVTYLPHQQIDKSRWDACIDGASNGLIYAYSFYLDHMALQWDALVLINNTGGYDAVMPLTWNKKYGIYYLYQPFACASLGLFGNNLNADMLDDFLQAVPRKFRYWDISFNHGNIFSLQHFNTYQRINYVLPLNDHYDALYSRFRDNIKRNTRKAAQAGAVIRKDIAVQEVLSLAKVQLQRVANISDREYASFEQLYKHLHAKKQAATYAICGATGQLLASAVFFFSHTRAYYILPGNHPNGKTMGASHALINAFIKDHAGSGILLDFEGSDVASLAFFYSSFGAEEEKYAAIKYNRLPPLLKWLKS